MHTPSGETWMAVDVADLLISFGREALKIPINVLAVMFVSFVQMPARFEVISHYDLRKSFVSLRCNSWGLPLMIFYPFIYSLYFFSLRPFRHGDDILSWAIYIFFEGQPTSNENCI